MVNICSEPPNKTMAEGKNLFLYNNAEIKAKVIFHKQNKVKFFNTKHINRFNSSSLHTAFLILLFTLNLKSTEVFYKQHLWSSYVAYLAAENSSSDNIA
jgi:hypothetical protein